MPNLKVFVGSKMATRSAILKAVEDASATVTAKVATSAVKAAAAATPKIVTKGLSTAAELVVDKTLDLH